VEIPCTAIRYHDPGAIPSGAGAFVFASRRGVAGFLRLRGSDAALSIGRRPLVCAVGASTARELDECGIKADIVADPPEGAVLAGVLKGVLQPGARVVMVRGNLRASEIDVLTAGQGFEVVPFEVYENVEPEIPRFEPFPVTAVFIGSPSAGRRLVAVNPWMKDEQFVAIGRTTAAALSELGVKKLRIAGADPNGWADCILFATAGKHRSKEEA
jgi:uroporphyrinogen-III synthase